MVLFDPANEQWDEIGLDGVDGVLWNLMKTKKPHTAFELVDAFRDFVGPGERSRIEAIFSHHGICSVRYQGDINCDYQIDTDDFDVWRQEFLKEIPTYTSDIEVNVGVPDTHRIDTGDFECWRRGFLDNDGCDAPTVYIPYDNLANGPNNQDRAGLPISIPTFMHTENISITPGTTIDIDMGARHVFAADHHGVGRNTHGRSIPFVYAA